MEASGAFWGPKFVLQGLTKLYKLLFVYSRSVFKKEKPLKWWPLVHSEILNLSCKVLLTFTFFLFIHEKNGKKK